MNQLKYQSRKAAGLCTTCGLRPSSGKIVCDICAQRQAEWRKENKDHLKQYYQIICLMD
jgi:hypothetical protein